MDWAWRILDLFVTEQGSLIDRTEKEIIIRVKEVADTKVNSLFDIINNTDSCRQMFEAVRELIYTKKSSSSVYVHNADGINIYSDDIKSEAMKTY